MKKTHYSLAHLAAAFVVGIVAVPLSTTALIRSQDDTGVHLERTQDQRIRANDAKAFVREQERRYWTAVDVYRDLVAKGVEHLTKPNISDPSSYERYLDSNFISNLEHAVDGDSFDPLEQYKDLPESERSLIDGYRSVKFCPDSLKNYYLQGFYDLCNALLESDAQARQQSLYDPSRTLRGFNRLYDSEYDNLRKRLDELQEQREEAGFEIEIPERSRRRRLDVLQLR